MRIPCDTIARLSKLLPAPDQTIDPIFRTMRLEQGLAIVTDKRFMAVEQIEPFDGVFHITLPDALVAQCRNEAAFNSVLTLVVTPALGFTTGQTTLGFSVPENIGVFPTGPTQYDEWRTRVVQPCVEPAPDARGAMIWQADAVARLAASSPSGHVIFETAPQPDLRSTVVRDINSSEWCGFFMPRLNDGMYHPPASVPGWLR